MMSSLQQPIAQEASLTQEQKDIPYMQSQKVDSAEITLSSVAL